MKSIILQKKMILGCFLCCCSIFLIYEQSKSIPLLGCALQVHGCCILKEMGVQKQKIFHLTLKDSFSETSAPFSSLFRRTQTLEGTELEEPTPACFLRNSVLNSGFSFYERVEVDYPFTDRRTNYVARSFAMSEYTSIICEISILS